MEAASPSPCCCQLLNSPKMPTDGSEKTQRLNVLQVESLTCLREGMHEMTRQTRIFVFKRPRRVFLYTLYVAPYFAGALRFRSQLALPSFSVLGTHLPAHSLAHLRYLLVTPNVEVPAVYWQKNQMSFSINT